MKKFNITGLCIPTKHYMVNVDHKVAEMIKLVEDDAYFTVNRARQFGKTTLLNQLARVLDVGNNKLKIHNLIFELRIYNYMIAKREMEQGPLGIESAKWDKNRNDAGSGF